MRLTTTLKAETDVSALADRLYADLTPAARKKAEAALIRANPHLATGKKLQPGLVVNLPDVPGVTVRPAATIGKDPAADLIGGLQEAVTGYREQLAKNSDALQADLDQQEALLKQKDVAAAIKNAPAAQEVAKAFASTLKDRRKAIETNRKSREEIFDQIAKDLGSLPGSRQ